MTAKSITMWIVTEDELLKKAEEIKAERAAKEEAERKAARDRARQEENRVKVILTLLKKHNSILVCVSVDDSVSASNLSQGYGLMDAAISFGKCLGELRSVPRLVFNESAARRTFAQSWHTILPEVRNHFNRSRGPRR